MSARGDQIERLHSEISDIQSKLDHKQYKDDKQKRDLMADKIKKEEELRSSFTDGKTCIF